MFAIYKMLLLISNLFTLIVIMWRIMVCIITMGLAAFGKVSYEGYKLFSIVPMENKHLLLLKALQNVGSTEVSKSFK